MTLRPTAEQLAEVTGTIVGLFLANNAVERIAGDVWQIVANQVLEEAAQVCEDPPTWDHAARIRALKGTP